MVRCAEQHQAELVILTRDSDYGPQFGNDILLNDHLKQEFKERVSKKRDVLVYKSASLALKHFHVAVPKNVEREELEFILHTSPSVDQIAHQRRRERVREYLLKMAERRGRTEDLDWLRIDEDEPTSVASAADFDPLDIPESKDTNKEKG